MTRHRPRRADHVRRDLIVLVTNIMLAMLVMVLVLGFVSRAVG